MTIVTRQSSPPTGTECPGDCTTNNNTTNSNNNNNNNNDEDTKTLLSRRKMKGLKRKINSDPPNPQPLDGIKSVMCETTNLTPAKSSSSSSASAAGGSDTVTISSPPHDLITPEGVIVEGVKKGGKKIAKAKLKNGSGQAKEDLVACRKSKRLLNKHSRFDKSKLGGVSSTNNALGRTVELINPLEKLDRDCSLTKVLFIGSLGLTPTFCSTTAKDPIGSLARICVQKLIKHRRSELEAKELLHESEKRLRRDSTDDENEKFYDDAMMEAILKTGLFGFKNKRIVISKSTVPTAQDEIISNKVEKEAFVSFHGNVTLPRSYPAKTNDNKDKPTCLETIKDCARKIFNAGSSCSISGTTSLSSEVKPFLEVLTLLHAEDNVNDEDEAGWSNWADHVLPEIQALATSKENEDSLRSNGSNPEPSVATSIPKGSIISGSKSKSTPGCSGTIPNMDT